MQFRLASLAAVAAAVAVVGVAHGGGNGPQRYTIGLFGDVPYGAQGRAEYPALLASINDSKVAFSIFDGDLKNGSERCDDALYTRSIAAFDSLERPVVWVPGDNDWTDCHRASNGGYDPIERLNHERALFAATDQSLGQKTMTLTRQSQDYPENWRFSCGPVVYAGLNVQARTTTSRTVASTASRSTAARPSPSRTRRSPARTQSTSRASRQTSGG